MSYKDVIGADFVARHFFYGIPVVVAKQSVDPFSPVWIRADTEKVLQRDIEVDKIEQEWVLFFEFIKSSSLTFHRI